MIKQIINWTAGGFFRTLGKFLLFLVITFIVALIMSKNDVKLPLKLIGIEKVYASTSVTPSSYYHKLEYSVGECTSIGCQDFVLEDIIESSWFTQQLTNFCPSGKTCKLRKDWYETTYSTSLDSGRTYTINFDTWISDRDSLNYYLQTQFYFTASNTGAYNGSSSSYISSFTCRAGLIEGTTSRVSWSCSFTPSTPINYLYIRMQYPYSTTSFYSYGCNKGEVLYDNSQTDAINQQTTIIQDSTTNIINNNNENTQDIINNQNENTQQIIDSNKVCNVYDKSNVVLEHSYLNSNGGILSSQGNYGISDYINIYNKDVKILNAMGNSAGTYWCLYNVNKSLISCYSSTTTTFPDVANSYFLRYTSDQYYNRPLFEVCSNGNQAIQDTLNNSDVSDTVDNISDFFHDFDIGGEGYVSRILLLPINLIESLIVPNVNSNLCFTLNGKQSCFPSGDFFWNRTGCHDHLPFGCPQRTDFKLFFQLIGEGAILWFLLRKLIKTIEHVYDPSKTNVEVMQL